MVAGGRAMRGVHSATRCVDVGEAVVAGLLEVADELCGGDCAAVRASGRTAQTAATQGRPVRARHSWARSSQRQGPAAASICSRSSRASRAGSPMSRAASAWCEHGDGVGGCGKKLGVGADESAEEDLRVGERTAGCGVGGDGADVRRGFGRREPPRLHWPQRCRVASLNDELDGADVVERCDGAAGDDGELGCERGDGDEAEVGAVAEQIVGALRGLGVVDLVALGELGVVGRVLEVPHERRGVEEVDGGDAEAG